jgi:hypothetical protein
MGEPARQFDQRRIEELEAEADHARRAYDLYKAKVYSSRPTSPTRLRELRRASELADRILKRARSGVDG